MHHKNDLFCVNALSVHFVCYFLQACLQKLFSAQMNKSGVIDAFACAKLLGCVAGLHD